MRYFTVLVVFLSSCALPQSSGPILVDPVPDSLPPASGPVFDNPVPDGWFANPWTPTSLELLVAESFPLQIRLHVVGELPDPCHQAHWTVVDDGVTLDVELVVAGNPAANCIQVTQPVDFFIDLGSWTESRNVLVNGVDVGAF